MIVRVKKGECQEQAATRCNLASLNSRGLAGAELAGNVTTQVLLCCCWHFRENINCKVVIFGLDDLLIFSLEETSHIQHVSEVLRRLQQHQLHAKLAKCSFHTDSVEFLSFIVSSSGISMSPDKVAAVRDWVPPTNVKGVMSFLGFANFYRQFIPKFSTLTAPLTALMKRNVPFVWSKDCQAAFDQLKLVFVNGSILHHVDFLFHSF